MTSNILQRFLDEHDYDVRKTGNGRWIDQKCALDAVCFVADCIVDYIQNGGRQPFQSPDIWHSEYAIQNVQHFSESSRERNKPASLSVLMDEGAEPAAEGAFEEDVIYETILEDLIAMLSEIKPKYGKIFRLLYNGATQQEMADELGIKQRTVSDDIKKIRSLVQPLAKDIFNR